MPQVAPAPAPHRSHTPRRLESVVSVNSADTCKDDRLWAHSGRLPGRDPCFPSAGLQPEALVLCLKILAVNPGLELALNWQVEAQARSSSGLSLTWVGRNIHEHSACLQPWSLAPSQQPPSAQPGAGPAGGVNGRKFMGIWSDYAYVFPVETLENMKYHKGLSNHAT